MLLDKVLDSDLKQADYAFHEALKNVYHANYCLIKNRYFKAARCFNQDYLSLAESIEQEIALKYVIPEASMAETYKKNMLKQQKYYRSRCKYFSAIVEGVLKQNQWKVNKQLRKYLDIFGLLRQIADEIADVEEDLRSGIVTMPVLFFIAKKDIKKIRCYWNGTLNFEVFKSIILEAGGYHDTYELGCELYDLQRFLIA